MAPEAEDKTSNRLKLAHRTGPGATALMSALGQKQTFALHQPMSALPPITTANADFPQKSCPLYPRKRRRLRFSACPLWANSGHGSVFLRFMSALMQARRCRQISNQSEHRDEGRCQSSCPIHIFAEVGRIWFCRARSRAIHERNLQTPLAKSLQ